MVTQGIMLEAELQVQCSFSHTHLRTSALPPNLPVLGKGPISHHDPVVPAGSVKSLCGSLELTALISNKPAALGLNPE